jgi:hypothetical protein
MRDKLAALEGVRGKFRAKFQRLGSKPSFRGPPKITVLLVNVCDSSGAELCDHVWLTQGEQLKRLALQPGEIIEMVATVKRYRKGYRGRHEWDEDLPAPGVDFKLANPAKLRVLGRVEGLAAQERDDRKSASDGRQELRDALEQMRFPI